jgi:phosphoribosyl-ATP pyrophosphohydrolase/phosphoribosyl-AMP cyclohydrolase
LPSWNKSCFREIEKLNDFQESNIDYSLDILNELKEVIKNKKITQRRIYTTYLFKEEKKKYTKILGRSS